MAASGNQWPFCHSFRLTMEALMEALMAEEQRIYQWLRTKNGTEFKYLECDRTKPAFAQCVNKADRNDSLCDMYNSPGPCAFGFCGNGNGKHFEKKNKK